VDIIGRSGLIELIVLGGFLAYCGISLLVGRIQDAQEKRNPEFVEKRRVRENKLYTKKQKRWFIIGAVIVLNTTWILVGQGPRELLLSNLIIFGFGYLLTR